MIEGYAPWEALGPVAVPTPFARAEFGVDCDHVMLPWAAAATFEDMVVTAQVAAAINLKATQEVLAYRARERAREDECDD